MTMSHAKLSPSPRTPCARPVRPTSSTSVDEVDVDLGAVAGGSGPHHGADALGGAATTADHAAEVTFTDVLGDKQFNVFAASISQYRTIAGSYVNLSRRFNYALQPMGFDDFKRLVTGDQPEAPDYFVYDAIKKLTTP